MANSVATLVRNSGGYMNFIDYVESWGPGEGADNKEFLRGDMWEFKFTRVPSIVFYPGDALLSKRITNVQVGIDTGVSTIEKRMRGGYTILQPGNVQSSGSLSISITDREDQACTYFCEDWKQKCVDRDTKYSFRKSDLTADAEMVLTNTGRVGVRTLKFYNLLINDATFDENGQAEESDRADITLSMRFEHYDRIFDNLV